MPSVVEMVETNLRLVGAAGYTAGLRSISTAAAQTGQTIQRLTSGLNPLNMLLGAIGTGITIQQIASINSQFEESQRLIAGIFTTMGMASDFNRGLQMASQTMDQITIAAARLPGEAEDYISVFQTGLTVVRQTFQGTTSELTAFTNDYTAIMSTLGVSSMEAGFSLTRALASGRGQVDQQSAAFMRLLPFIQQATRESQHQVSSIQQFNRLTQEQRGEVLRLTMAQEGLQRMLDNAGTSWNAQTGALASLARMMGRMATSPLFEAMKRWLGDFNAMFMDSEGHLTTLGAALTTIGEYLSNNVVRGIDSLMSFLSPAADTIYGVGKAVIDELTPVVDAVRTAFSRVESASKTVWPFIQALSDNLRVVISTLGAFSPAATSYIEFISRIPMVIGHLLPQLTALARISAAIYNVFATVLRVVMQLMFGVQQTDRSFEGMIAQIDTVAAALDIFATRIERGAQVALNFINAFAGAHGITLGQQGGLVSSIQTAISEAQAKAESRRHEASAAAASGAPAVPGARPSANVHQDFRYSRFDIMQRFAEGFDPDRIAVAFADDIGRLGEQRLQSGLEPVFGVR